VYSNWSCTGIDPYKSAIPPGTSCSVTCPSWEGIYLSSTCLPSGQWSKSVSNKARSLTLSYSAPFPTPVDQPVFQCGCPDLGPFIYNPNTEPGTKFTCDDWPESKYSKPGGWILTHQDRCSLYCSDERKAVTSVYCKAGKWKGEPERGFWCYNRPEAPEPSDSDHSSEENSTSTTTLPPSSQSKDVLFIGPGSQSKGKSEVLLLPSLKPANCTPPIFPGGHLHGYVGRMTEDGPLLCGGVTNDYTHKCHLLGEMGDWFGTPPLVGQNVVRGYMAAVEVNDGWLVTGGHDKKRPISTSEIWQNHTWNKYTPLPKAVYGHCIVRLNSTHFFLTGGHPDQKSAYTFSKPTGFVKQADMLTGRYYHGCAMHGNKFVFVASGTTSDYFSLETMKWLPGPVIPTSSVGGKMVTIEGTATFFGGQKIYQLEKIGLTTVDWWKWTEVGEMKTDRKHFDIIKMKMSDCENWNKKNT